MPSNQCTNSLTELSFAIGNMIGAQQCDVDDWKQIRAQLLAWECSDRGKVGDALDSMRGTASNAIAACGREDGCRATDCEDLFDNHEVLLQELNLYAPGHLGRGYRGAIPPKVKGSPNLERTGGLQEQRSAEIKRIGERKAAEEAAKTTEATRRAEAAAALKKAADEEAEKQKRLPAGYTNPSRGMGYGNGERRERWYPARA